MKTFTRTLFIMVIALLALTFFTACGSTKKETILIYTSAVDFQIEYMSARLKEEFPDYECIIEYKDTGSHAATLIAEGAKTDCDITHDLEYGYLEQLAAANVLADLSSYDSSVFVPDAILGDFFLPELRNGGAIILNLDVLKEKNLSKPQSYADLLKPEFKNLISMPNPKSSGTGYMFLKSLVNAMGEAEALAYFDALTENILAYTSSGSGPVNALKSGEVAVGLGMTAQAVAAINEGTNLEILFFEEGSPYSMYGQAIIAGKEQRACVKEVFDFLINTYNHENNEKFFPEQIYRDVVIEIENYPTNIKYADMSGNTIDAKAALLDKWMY